MLLVVLESGDTFLKLKFLTFKNNPASLNSYKLCESQ